MTTIPVNKDPREEKRRIAASVRGSLAEHHTLAINLVSAPGSGKTTLLEQVLPLLAKNFRLAVIEADTATRNDADRIEAVGIRTIMIESGVTGCHLSPAAAESAFGELSSDELDLVVIENVGNLVCPSDVDLGEDAKVVMVSIAEGEDKPLKYPLIFMNSSLSLINKIDAAEALGADVDLLERNIRAVNPSIEVIRLSARTGKGVDTFIAWLTNRIAAKRTS